MRPGAWGEGSPVRGWVERSGKSEGDGVMSGQLPINGQEVWKLKAAKMTNEANRTALTMTVFKTASTAGSFTAQSTFNYIIKLASSDWVAPCSLPLVGLLTFAS